VVRHRTQQEAHRYNNSLIFNRHSLTKGFFQYILPSDSTVYIGCIGKDKYGEQLKDICVKAGVRTEYRYDDEQPTGRCGVVITGHNRSLCTDLAAANCYKLEHLKQPEIWKLVENAKYYYVGGYHMTVCVPAILALAEEAASKDKPFMLNLSAPFIPQFFKDGVDQTFSVTRLKPPPTPSRTVSTQKMSRRSQSTLPSQRRRTASVLAPLSSPRAPIPLSLP
jgi:hypothetical protein